MVAGLPVLLYPILGIAVLKFAAGFVDKKTVVGLVSGPGPVREFPPRFVPSPVAAATAEVGAAQSALQGGPANLLAGPALVLAHETLLQQPHSGRSPAPVVGWFSAAPPVPGCIGIARVGGAAALVHYSHVSHDFPLLAERGQIGSLYLQQPFGPVLVALSDAKLQVVWLEKPDRGPLNDKKVDVILSASPDFWAKLEKGQPSLRLQYRDDEDSRLAVQRTYYILARWKKHIKEVRFARQQLPPHFDEPFALFEPDSGRGGAGRSVMDLLIRVFPFMLVMWSLAGALYPAVDLCAGEKERGTMETLLISPAGREEIVIGKFLTIWMFSAGTALLNLLSMGITTWTFASTLPRVELTPMGLVWSTLLLLPLSAFFSAVCLAIGAYARSSKEGQYYLMPLFVVTMPLIFLTLAPGVELNSFYSMVPVTGVALLMQRLLTQSSADNTWFYFASVMAPIALYSWLALRWAIDQFQREEVLFREAERLDLKLYLRRLFREKETRPSTGQALFCFFMLLSVRWLSEGLGGGVSLMARSLVVVVAFVAAPPIFMAVMLTTRPRQVLGLRWPAWPYLAAAVLFVPLEAYFVSAMQNFPRLMQVLRDRQLFVEQAFGNDGSWHAAILFLAFLTAAGKEIAFRGFVFAGLLKRMRPWPAILVSSFLFAAFHMNVFLLPPLFLLGILLGVVALRSGSLLPGIVLHGSSYALLLLGSSWSSDGWAGGHATTWEDGVTLAATAAALGLLWWQNSRSGAGLWVTLFGVPAPVTPEALEPDIAELLARSSTTAPSPDGKQ